MSEITFVCRECGTAIKPIPAEDGSGVWACENGHECGVWLNQGKLDLGLIEPDGENDFQVFVERP